MTDRNNNESVSASNSLSLIFKKPKALLKVTRQSERNNQINSNSVNVPSSSRRTKLNEKDTNVKNLFDSASCTVNFSKTFDSVSENISTIKKRRVTPKPKKTLKVSFSRSVNITEDSVTLENKIGYLRKLRSSMKPSNDANFSIEAPVMDESTVMNPRKQLTVSIPKIIENASLSISTPPSSSSWNTPTVRPIRRCSTPLKGISQPIRINETNLSLIPRALPFSDNEIHSSSPSVVPGAQEKSHPVTHSKDRNFSFQSTINNSAGSSCSTSFVTKVFKKEDTIPTSNENVPPPVEKLNRVREIDLDLRHKSVFPKFATFCNRQFYKYLIHKMEPKYGIETNSRVVKITQKLHKLVENINSLRTDYQQLVHKLQKLLFRHNIVLTCSDFYQFSLKFLPKDVIMKIVPIIQPFGRPLLVDFDSQTVFNPIAIE